MKKILFAVFMAVIVGVGGFFGVVQPLYEAAAIPDEVRLTQQEYDSGIRLGKAWGLTHQTNSTTRVSDDAERWIDLKLLGIFPVKRIKVDVFPFDTVSAGGVPIGFVAKTDGVIVLENAGGLKKGDVIKRVNGAAVESVAELKKLTEETGEQACKIELVRKRKNLNIESELKSVWLKDETSGMGILTYVNPDNNNFASLGHRLTDFETGTGIDVRGGDVFLCNIIGVEKSAGRTVGEFKTTLKKGSEVRQGSVLSSNENGVFGCLFEDSVLKERASEVLPVASRYGVKPGKAKLRTSLDGENVRDYDIEIVKARFQKEAASKSMVVRITDKELLAKTGGIIHGMSGSPIIQNGHIVGALTHVTVADSAVGYGIYIDFVVP